MQSNTSTFKSIQERFFWSVAYQNRKLVVPILMFAVFVMGLILTQKYVTMDMQLKKLAKIETLYVVGTAKDLNIGDQVRSSDLLAVKYLKNEYDKLKKRDPVSQVESPALFKCKYTTQAGIVSSLDQLVGRVVKVPVPAGSPLRTEFLAKEGTVPGIKNLIKEGHSLFDLKVPQSGFNVFVRPNDKVDLYKVDKTGSSLICSKAKVILVDSKTFEYSPLQVEAIPNKYRNLSIEVPESVYPALVKARNSKTLTMTYRNKNQEVLVAKKPAVKKVAKKKSFFQPLTFMTPGSKEIIKR